MNASNVLFIHLDIDECTAETDNCGQKHCKDVPGSFRCSCDEYSADAEVNNLANGK